MTPDGARLLVVNTGQPSFVRRHRAAVRIAEIPVDWAVSVAIHQRGGVGGQQPSDDVSITWPMHVGHAARRRRPNDVVFAGVLGRAS
jgi:hypothetical protein